MFDLSGDTLTEVSVVSVLRNTLSVVVDPGPGVLGGPVQLGI